MAIKPGLISEVENLEKGVVEHEKSIKQLQERRRGARKKLQGPLGKLGFVILAALMTSSCSLHAGEILGRWSVDQLFDNNAVRLQAIIDAANGVNGALGLAVEIVGRVAMIPVTLVFYMPYTLLRIVEEALSMTVPAAVPFLAYIEGALVALVLLWVVRMAIFSHDDKRIKAEIRSIDSEIRDHRAEASKMASRAKEIKASEKYKLAQDDYELGKRFDEAEKRYYEDFNKPENVQKRFLVYQAFELLPKGIEREMLHPYVWNEPERIVQILEQLNLSLGVGQRELNPQEAAAYLARLDELFRQGMR